MLPSVGKQNGEVNNATPVGNDMGKGTAVERFSSESAGSVESDAISTPHESHFEKI